MIIRHRLHIIFFLIFISFINHSIAQDYWMKVDKANSSLKGINLQNNSKLYLLNEEKFRFNFNKNTLKSNFKNEIYIPNEKGEYEHFKITKTQLLSNRLSIKYEDIKTFVGVSRKRKNVKARITITNKGLSYWLRIPNKEDYFFQPVRNRKGLHYGYSDSNETNQNGLNCKTKDLKNKILNSDFLNSKKSYNQNNLKTYRIAIMGTGEYTSFWGDNDDSNGDNSEDAYRAVVNTINRVNEIYENELQIKLELISDASLMFLNANQDPFKSSLNDEAQVAMDSIVGNENYDLGHLFDYGQPDGDAGCVGCVCENGAKGRAYSIHPFEDIDGGVFRNDYFDLDYVAHEIGHQFGAYHTFAFQTENSGSNVEPGSGSTIMGYAGITGEDDIQAHGDPYFHYVSIKEINNYVSNLTCTVSSVSISNNAYNIDAGKDYNIPKGTAYELSPIVDEPIPDQINFNWEQLDSGQIGSSNFGPLNVVGPIARSILPSNKKTRYVPNIERVISGNLTQTNPTRGSAWETVTDVGRVLNWGITLRDLRDPNQGLISQDNMKINVSSNSGPFLITSQNSANIIWEAGSKKIITWDVANTNKSPIETQNVTIFLSEDGGYNYPIKLIENTLNDGEEEIIVPSSISSKNCRIKIKADNSIYYAINKNNFEIKQLPFVINYDENNIEVCSKNEVTINFKVNRFLNFDKSINLKIQGPSESLRSSFSKEVFLSSDSEGELVLSELNKLSPGIYEFVVVAESENNSYSFSFNVNYKNEISVTQNLISPENNSEKLNLFPELKWEKNENIDKFRLQVSKNDDFTNLELDETLYNNSYQLSDLNSDQVYFWRVQPINICGTGDFSNYNIFKTDKISCIDYYSSNLPIDLNDANSNSKGITVAEVSIPYDVPIVDLNVLVNIDHSWLEDLTLYLESPDGVKIILSKQIGGSGNNYSETVFDQDSNNNIFNSSPPFSGSYKPVQSLEAFYNRSAFGKWKLIVEDSFQEDTGSINSFSIEMCLLGTPMPNSDEDSIVDDQDNCPNISNQDQLDSDGNGIGDICDIFSEQNILLSKSNSTCKFKNNGKIQIEVKADYDYNVIIDSDNGFYKNLNFDLSGLIIENLSPGKYSICITSNSFTTYISCYETLIVEPELNVQSFLNLNDRVLNLNLSGSNNYIVTLNDDVHHYKNSGDYKLDLSKKINYLKVETENQCQNFYEEWIPTEDIIKVFPNPVLNKTNILFLKNQFYNISLFDSSGNLLWDNCTSQNYINSSIEIDMTGFVPGLYILEAKNQDLIKTFKIIKE